MDATTLRQLFLEYFRAHGHAILGSAALIPEHDSSVLFTTAGMHPLVPYLLGEPHPAGTRLASCQKCLRTNDILEVGDAIHLTFFEMLGNWSLGDYWKPESVAMSLTFLVERLGLDPERLFVTCFAGDATVPPDDEAAEMWRRLGIPERHIAFLGRDGNWWGPAGATGPCGPDTEIFYDMHPDGPAGDSPATNPQRFWEIWNNVFLQYDLQQDGTYRQLARHNVDTGMGLERTLATLQGVSSPYETELFVPIISAVRTLAPHSQPFAERIIADHVRAAMFIMAEQIVPGNVGQPYIARRLIRRASRYGQEIGITKPFLARLAEVAIPTLSSTYPELEQQRGLICQALDEEETRFARTLTRGAQEVDRAIAASKGRGEQLLPGATVFRLYETYGFPAELTQEVAARQGLGTDMAGFTEAFRMHQQQSRHGASDHFRGGLAERLPETTRLHTATHLLQAALREVLGPVVEQRGSNITAERLRFDFTSPERPTASQLAAVERLVNEQIARDMPVITTEMSLEEAKRSGALGLFEERYGPVVKVYSIGEFSKEICGGPHVSCTGELGHFRIVKEESVGAGIRRIRAVL